MFTAPTALRAIRKFDPTGALMKQHDITSLRTMFVAGERADPDTVSHFQRLLGVPVVDHWWQAEILESTRQSDCYTVNVLGH